MRNISNQFKNELFNDNRNYVIKFDITFKNGKKILIDNSKILMGTFGMEQATSGTSTFDIGSAIINKIDFTLNNLDDEFSEYDFQDALINNILVGLKLPDGTTESVKLGTFRVVDQPTYNGSSIAVEALDNMSKFDKDSSVSNLSYPATLLEIVQDACGHCGVLLGSASFPNYDFVVEKKPESEAVTFRQLILWCAQIACQYATTDIDGALIFKWYDVETLNQMKNMLDGGYFDGDTPYSSGDSADGGSFNPWNTGDTYDSGTFSDQKKYHHIYSIAQKNIATDDVVISGIKVTESTDDYENDPPSYLYGEEGYVIKIEGNKLIQKGKGEAVAQFIGSKVVGMQFRPFDLTCLSDPSMEAGDCAFITDRKQNSYITMITKAVFKPGNYEEVGCYAESAAKNSTQRYSESAQAVVEAKKNTENKISVYDLAVQNMNQLAANTMGYFTTSIQQEDGSTIAYRHDKPTLAESKIVYKSGIEGFFFFIYYQGTDEATEAAGKWQAGFDSNGNAAVNILSVIGINFDWARGGTLTLGGQNNGNGTLKVLDASGNQIGYWDNTGIHITDGEIRGTVISVGGAANINGVFRIYDNSGNQIGYWDNTGVHATRADISGKITSSEGNIGGFTLSSQGFSANISGKAKYTTADILRAQLISLRMIEVDDETIKYYDLNGDGRVTSADLLLMQRIINGQDQAPDIQGKVHIDPASVDSVLNVEGTSDNAKGFGVRIGIGKVDGGIAEFDFLNVKSLTVGNTYDTNGNSNVNITGDDIMIRGKSVYSLFS